jgi:serine/threonine-protein kinase HipA
MVFKPIQKLSVNRTLSTGQVVWVGTLAQNSQGIYFQYDETYFFLKTHVEPLLMATARRLLRVADLGALLGASSARS